MAKNPSGFREFLRKRIVALKRKPQNIPLLVLGIAFLYYSLNLTSISNTTAKINTAGMGLSGFAAMLFSILSLVAFMNAFPHRKKVNVPMLVIMFVMVGIVIYADVHYAGSISAAINPPWASRRCCPCTPSCCAPSTPTSMLRATAAWKPSTSAARMRNPPWR